MPGPSAERPVTFIVQGPKNEDGEAPKVELDLTLEEVTLLERDFRQAGDWAAAGVWKPTGRKP